MANELDLARLSALLAEASALFEDTEFRMAFDKLGEAQRMIDEHKSQAPTSAAVKRDWNVVGTVHYADGFDIIVHAATEDEARQIAEDNIRQNDSFVARRPELQEVCIEGCFMTDKE